MLNWRRNKQNRTHSEAQNEMRPMLKMSDEEAYYRWLLAQMNAQAKKPRRYYGGRTIY